MLGAVVMVPFHNQMVLFLFEVLFLNWSLCLVCCLALWEGKRESYGLVCQAKALQTENTQLSLELEKAGRESAGEERM